MKHCGGLPVLNLTGRLIQASSLPPSARVYSSRKCSVKTRVTMQVSSSAAPNSLPYQPYQMKPPPRPPSTAAASALVTPPATSVTFGSQPSSFASGHAGRMSSEPSGASLGDAPGHQQSAAIAPSSQVQSPCIKTRSDVGFAFVPAGKFLKIRA